MERMRKVNELLHHAVAEIIRGIDLSLDVFVTITHAETSRDLKHATIFLTVLPDNKRISTIRQLQKHAGFIQRELGRNIRIKYTPKLRFSFDTQSMKAQHVYDILDKTDIEEPGESEEASQ